MKKEMKRKRGTKNKSDKNKIVILIRYIILLAIVFALPFIYNIVKPLTIIPSLYLLDLFYGVQQFNDYIIINTTTFIEMIPACIAGSAYLLLLILNLSTPLNIKRRIFSIIFSLLVLLILNILRIVVFSIWYHEKILLFDFTHKLTWYVLSTLFVVVIWLAAIKIFSVKEIPFYTDIKGFTH